jgi:hypothetical protein
MHFSAKVNDEIAIPRQPPGAKLSICYFAGGEFHGERLRGELLPGGGDWAVYRSDDHLDIEVRGVLRTHDQALIYMRYDGYWHAASGILPRVLAHGGHAHYRPEEHYFRVFARFETADPRYSWLNGILALGVGTRTPEGVSYQFYEVR